MAHNEVVHIRVVDKRRNDVVFDGKVCTSVSPQELCCLGPFLDRGIDALVTQRKGGDVVTSFVGFRGYVELVGCSALYYGGNGVLYVGAEDGVLRKSNVLPLCECKMISLWDLPRDECEKVFLHENLEELELNRCKLVQLPGDIGKMKNLKKLRLNRLNDLTNVPDEVGQLSSLRELWISNCGISHLPASIVGLDKLETLALADLKRFESLPETMERMSNLKMLLLEACDAIERVPSTIAQLHKLEMLSLTSLRNLKKHFPEELGRLPHVHELMIGYCDIECLPKSISGMIHLQDLILVSLSEVKTLPEDLGQLPNLKTLFLERCAIESLPTSIAGLTRLEQLKLMFLGDLKHLPEDIGKLKSLRKLKIFSCAIETFPKSFQSLKSSLKSVSLSSLKSLSLSSEDILAFSNLKHFSILSCNTILSLEHSQNAFWSMIASSLSLLSMEVDFLQTDQKSMSSSLQQNGSIVEGIGIHLSELQDYFKRNKENHERAKQSVVVLLALKRFRRVMLNVPKEVVAIIARMLLETKCDLPTWSKR